MHEVLDALALAVAYVARSHGNYVSASTVTAGLPVSEDGLALQHLEAAGANCGLRVHHSALHLGHIPRACLPCLLMFHDGTVRLLVAYDEDSRQAKLLDPEDIEHPQYLGLDVLLRLYSGTVILFEPIHAEPGVPLAARADQHWFWSELAPFWRDYAVVALASLVISLLALAPPLFIMNVYDRILPNFAVASLWALSVGLVLALLADAALKMARYSILGSLGQKADRKLSSKIFAHVQRMDFAIKTKGSGSYASTIQEYERLREFFSSTALLALLDLCFSGVLIGILFVLVGPIAWITFLAVPVVCLLNLAAQIPLHKTAETSSQESTQRQSILMEMLGGFESMRSLNAEGHMLQRWERSVERSSQTNLESRFWSNLALTATGWVQGLVSALIIIWGVYRVDAGLVNMGGLIAAMMLSARVLAPLASVASTLGRLKQTLHIYHQLDALMKLPLERPAGTASANLTSCQGTLQFREVSFSYPESEHSSVEQVSFQVQPGETIGILGGVGAGKTSLGRLLSGLYYPTNGTVLIDGVDTRQFDPSDLRRKVGYVAQDSTLFPGSLRENLCLGLPHIKPEALYEACAITGLDLLIQRHPAGLNMPVGENGRALSGGQRQCVALARMLLRKPKILFLDEPSSQLDLAAEERLIAGLRAVGGPQLTLLISTHRPSLLQLASRVIALDQGRLIADGPVDDVLQQLRRPAAAPDTPVSLRERLRA